MRSVYGMPALCMRQVYAQRVGNTLCIRCKLAEASPKFWQELDARRRTDQFSVFWLNFQRAGHASVMCDHSFNGVVTHRPRTGDAWPAREYPNYTLC